MARTTTDAACLFCSNRRPPRFPLFPYTTLFRSASSASRRARPCRSQESCRSSRSGAKCGRRGRSRPPSASGSPRDRSEEHTSELQSHHDVVCRLLLEKKKKNASAGTLKLDLVHH